MVSITFWSWFLFNTNNIMRLWNIQSLWQMKLYVSNDFYFFLVLQSQIVFSRVEPYFSHFWDDTCLFDFYWQDILTPREKRKMTTLELCLVYLFWIHFNEVSNIGIIWSFEMGFYRCNIIDYNIIGRWILWHRPRTFLTSICIQHLGAFFGSHVTSTL